VTHTVDRNGGSRFVLPLGPTCPHHPEESAPGEPGACPECGCPITPGREHPACDPRLCLLGLGEEDTR
jgi:hypothetical protein